MCEKRIYWSNSSRFRSRDKWVTITSNFQNPNLKSEPRDDNDEAYQMLRDTTPLN
jgi:hypothetical protein